MIINNIDKDILETIYDNLENYSDTDTLETLIYDTFDGDDYIYYYDEAMRYYNDNFNALSDIYADYTDITGNIINPFDIFNLVNNLISFRVYETLKLINIDYNDTDKIYLTEFKVKYLRKLIDEVLE